MANCTGYSFQSNITLCADGAVGNGATTTLNVSLDSCALTNCGTAFVAVPDWDGTETTVDFTSQADSTFNARVGGVLYYYDSCDIDSVMLTISPDTPGGTTGMVELEVVISNCSGFSTTTPSTTSSTTTPSTTTTTTTTTVVIPPTIDEACGNSGPHTISEMLPFTLTATGGCV